MVQRIRSGHGARNARRCDRSGRRSVRLPEHAGLVGENPGFLFDLDERPAGFDRERLRDRLQALAAQGIYVGGSSWKYEGWLGQIYSRSLYQTRGKFSKNLFEDTCLAEYASVFPTVCGDFAFYQFPSEAFWAKLFRQTPDPAFRWAFKVPEQITVPVWPVHPRYGALAGLESPTFLDGTLFEQAFLRVLDPYRQQIGALIFEFGTFRERSFASDSDFVKVLDPFLDRLPEGWRFAVEIRNAEFLTPLYFDCLRAHRVTHVYNAWTRMPEIADQMRIAGSQTTDLVVARALLRRGRPYEEGVRTFSPYDQVRDVNEPVRQGLRELIHTARVNGRPAFIYVNNRLEGNSPATIAVVAEE
ncbi:MAG TPA: DUF72 domain-containing protein [Bryobacteraceae bacterium]|nr:DUF72 domain-containing protein [Bryobacteraceae bacterium]